MPTIVATIGGTTVAVMNGTIVINETANGKATLSCDVDTLSGTFRPAVNDEVVVTENGTTIFGGYVLEPSERSKTDSGSQAYFTTSVRAEDYGTLTTRRFASASRSSENLKTRLTWVVATYLTDYGVTLDAGQANGPTLPATVYEDKRIDELLNDLTTLSSGYIWKFNYSKVLKMELPSSVAAPFDVLDSNTNAIGDITVEPIATEFANRIIVRAGTGIHDVTDTFTGDGSTSKFVLSMPYVGNASGFVYNNSVAENIAVKDTGFNLAVFWLYDPSDNSINRVAGAGPPANTNPISITYQAQFPLRVTSDGGAAAADVVERVIAEPDIFDKTVAQSLADSYLSIYNQRWRTAKYTTLQTGIHPGMQQHITKSVRNLNHDCLVSEVTIRHVDGNHWVREVQLSVGGVFQGSWRDTLKLWNSGGTSYGGSNSVTVLATNSNFFRYDTGGPRLYVSGGDAYFDADGLTLGTPSSFQTKSAVKFARPTTGSFGQSGDINALHGETVIGSPYVTDLTLENVIVGIGAGSGGSSAQAKVTVRANGWNNVASGSQTGDASLYLESGVATPYAKITATDVEITGNLSVNGTSHLGLDTPKFLVDSTTGAGGTNFGANNPAVTVTSTYAWLKVKTSDGSTGWVPVWK